MNCKLCNKTTAPHGVDNILGGRYSGEFSQCMSCGFIQADNPVWLGESYKNAINDMDIGCVDRNFRMALISKAIITLCLGGNGRFLDYGGGYGIFVRHMRDFGFDFWWHDRHCENIFAKGFEIADTHASKQHFRCITAFEVFEHLVDPVTEIKHMLELSDFILFSTVLLPDPAPPTNAWWYYGLEHGQHVAFYSKRSLEKLAERLGLVFLTNNCNIHLLGKAPISNWLFRLGSNSRFSYLFNGVSRRKTLIIDDFETARKKTLQTHSALKQQNTPPSLRDNGISTVGAKKAIKKCVFVVCGHLPVIAASIAAQALNPDGLNVLVSVEARLFNSTDKSPLVGDDYASITRVLSSYASWDFRLNPVVEAQYPSLTKDFIRFLRYQQYLKKIGRDIRQKLKPFGEFDEAFVSGNSFLWPFVLSRKTRLNLIAHGTTEYNCIRFFHPEKLKERLKILIRSIMLGASVQLIPDRIILNDGGNAQSPLKGLSLADAAKVVSLESALAVNRLFQWFEGQIRTTWPDAYAEIKGVRDKMQPYPDRFVYLPISVPSDHITDETASALFQDETKQIVDFSFERSIILVKPHPTDKRNFTNILGNTGVQFVELKHPVARLLPAEFLIQFLGKPVVFGNYSTCLLYAKWWLNCKSVLTDVAWTPSRDFLLKEYSHMLPDFNLLRERECPVEAIQRNN